MPKAYAVIMIEHQYQVQAVADFNLGTAEQMLYLMSGEGSIAAWLAARHAGAGMIPADMVI